MPHLRQSFLLVDTYPSVAMVFDTFCHWPCGMGNLFKHCMADSSLVDVLQDHACDSGEIDSLPFTNSLLFISFEIFDKTP